LLVFDDGYFSPQMTQMFADDVWQRCLKYKAAPEFMRYRSE